LRRTGFNSVTTASIRSIPAARRATAAGLPADALVIGVVASSARKGLDTLLSSFALAVPPARYELVLVGSGSMFEALQSQAQALEIFEDCLSFPSPPRRHLAAAR